MWRHGSAGEAAASCGPACEGFPPTHPPATEQAASQSSSRRCDRSGGGSGSSRLLKGRGARSHAPRSLGQRLQAHIEIFGANRVALLPAGIGTPPPRLVRDGRLTHAPCFGALVTLDPTGVIYFTARERLTVGDVFRAWGAKLGARRIASFTGRPGACT